MVEEPVGPRRLLLSVAVKPRPAIRWIIDHRGTRGIILLVTGAFLSSAVKEFDWRELRHQTGEVEPLLLTALIAAGAIVGLGFAIGLFYGVAWIATVAGRFVGGSGDYRAVRIALAWAFSPFIFALLYRIPALIFWPAALAASGGGNREVVKVSESIQISATAFADVPIYQVAILMLLEAAVVIWWLVVASNTLGEAQGVSALAGFGNLLLAIVLPVVGILAIVAAAFLAFR
jgi:hypothetical protein